MRAIVIARPGGPEVLELRDVPTPTAQRGEVRVKIHATAVNRADLLQRMGMYPAPPDSPADIPGLEYAGEIDAIGEAVQGFAVGDRVFGLAGGGTYADALVVPARSVAKMPNGLSYTDAAAIPEAFITAYDAMVTLGKLGSGERVLINAAGSGVGTAAVQIARAIGAYSIGTARTASKLERARELGLDHAVVATNGQFAKDVLAHTGGAGVDVVLELVGGDYLKEDIVCAAPRARIILVGLMGGLQTPLDLGTVLRKRLAITGTMLRARPLEEKIQAMQIFARHVVPLFSQASRATNPLRAVVDRIFPLTEAAAAHSQMEKNEGFGKLVLQM